MVDWRASLKDATSLQLLEQRSRMQQEVCTLRRQNNKVKQILNKREQQLTELKIMVASCSSS